MPAVPKLPDAALLCNHTVEQNEAHHAVQVDEQYEKHNPGNYQEGNQQRESGWIQMWVIWKIKVGRRRLGKTMRPMAAIALKIGRAAAARAHLTRQKSDKCKLGPLRSPKRL
jgi:hypothetical protein